MTPLTLYIDPGTANTAWVIAEPDPARADLDIAIPLLCVDHGKIETGTKVPRPPERVTSYIRKSDGVEVVQDMERVVTPADRRRVGDALVEIARAHCVTRAVMELAGHVHLHGSEAAKWSQAESAKQLGKVEELILDRLEGAGLAVVTVSSNRWRARLRIFLPAKVVGSPSWSRRDLLPILGFGFGDSWPSKAGEDERDAGGIAMWDALPALVPKRKARTGSPRKRTPGDGKPRGKRGPRGEIDKKKHAARRIALREERRPAREAAALAARVDAGCLCGLRKGRHKAGCPRHVPKVTARATVAAERARRRARLATHDLAVDGVTSRASKKNG